MLKLNRSRRRRGVLSTCISPRSLNPVRAAIADIGRLAVNVNI